MWCGRNCAAGFGACWAGALAHDAAGRWCGLLYCNDTWSCGVLPLGSLSTAVAGLLLKAFNRDIL